MQEHQRIFYYMKLKSGGSIPEGTASSKKGKSKLQSCTLKFFCLSKVSSEKLPNSVFEKTGLSNCGLGPGSITIDLINSASDVHHNQVEKFPLLQAGGGYELLLYQRGGVGTRFPQYSLTLHSSKNKEASGESPSLCSTPTAGPWCGRKWAELHNSESKQVVFTSNKVSWYEIISL